MTNSKLLSLLLLLFIVPAFACSSPEDNGDEGVTDETEITRESGEQEKEDEKEHEPDKAEEDDMEESDEEDGDDTSETDGTDEEESDELNEELVEKGEKLYKEKACASCHTYGKGRLVGPDLQGATERREEKWLKNWIKNPDKMLQTDPIAKEMLKEYMVPMPNQGLNDEEVDAVVEYMKHMDKK